MDEHVAAPAKEASRRIGRTSFAQELDVHILGGDLKTWSRLGMESKIFRPIKVHLLKAIEGTPITWGSAEGGKGF